MMMQNLRDLAFAKVTQVAAVIVGLFLVFVWRGTWWPRVSVWGDRVTAHAVDHTEDAHAEHPAHEAHPVGTPQAFLDLSSEAMKNLGLTAEYLQPISLASYRKTISVPALIVERPGQTL